MRSISSARARAIFGRSTVSITSNSATASLHLVGLQRADQMQLDLGMTLLQLRPFGLCLLHAVLAEDALAGEDACSIRASGDRLADRDERARSRVRGRRPRWQAVISSLHDMRRRGGISTGVTVIGPTGPYPAAGVKARGARDVDRRRRFVAYSGNALAYPKSRQMTIERYDAPAREKHWQAVWESAGRFPRRRERPAPQVLCS